MSEKTLTKVKPARYGFAMFGTSIPINMFKSFAAIFYVDMLGLDMKKYSLVLFIYTFVDAIDNPVYGLLSDRTRTKWGRRRPWLLIGTPLLVLFFILFYCTPEFIQNDTGKLFIYMLLMYILTGTLDSLVNANYGALFPELFKKDEERAKTNSFRQICQLFAMAISIALTPMITEKIGYRTTAIVYGVVALIVMMYCFWGCREPELIEEEVEKTKLFSSIFALITNPKFWIYGFCGAFYSAAFSLISQAIPFYVKYTLQKGGSTTTIMLGTVLVVAVIGIIIWSNIVKKWDIMKVWRSGFIIMAVSFIPLYFVNSFVGAVVIACIVGFGVAACLATMDCIGAKIVDDDFRRHGIKREGIISSLTGVMNRLNGLYTSLAFYFVSTQFGFVNGDDPGTNPALASRVLLCVFPAAAMIIASVITFFLHFDEKMKKYLIINADDFGYNKQQNEAVMHLLSEGLITSTSVMAVAPEAAECNRLDGNAYSVGVHLTINSDSPDSLWKSLTESESLGGINGLPSDGKKLTFGAKRKDVRAELEAQLGYLLSKGVSVDHADNHCGTLYGINGRRFYLDAFDFCAAHNLPFRFPKTPGFAERQIGRKLPSPALKILNAVVKKGEEKGVKMLDDLVSNPWSIERIQNYENLREYYLNAVDNCIDGVTEMFLHPALPIDETVGQWTKRVYEYELLKSGDILQRAHEKILKLFPGKFSIILYEKRK